MPSDPFHTQIQKAIQNPALQAALDNNTERRKNAYTAAFSTLPDPALTRQQARRVRQEVITNLEYYADQFVQNAQANGFLVHRAANGAEAIRIFLDIAKAHQARLVVKSKTMVSEEIEFNHALAEAGIRAVETDLGEFIVQLRGERPAHILTPAVHLRRAEVGQTFHEKLGIPFTDDVSTLTQTARVTLRKLFLEADIGVSGVNFGVAETGMICVLTNEGNGRMCTTVPPVHVALMGIERIVPSMADLATIISVLPRASAGQIITVYTNLIRGPSQPDDPDGPEERHVILLDNGRLALRGSSLEEALYCIRCGACLNTCPVFREIGGHAYVGAEGQVAVYSGPIGSVISPGLFGSQAFANLAHASTLCGACRDACPVGIDLPRMLLEVRAGAAQKTAQPQPAAVSPGTAWGLKIYSWFTASPARFRFAQKMASIVGRVFADTGGWIRLPALTGWGASKDFPQPVGQTFRERFQNHVRSSPETQLETRTRFQKPEFEPVVPAEPFVSEVQVPAATEADMLVRFEKELTNLGATVIRTDRIQLPQQIAGIVRETGQEQVWTWAEAELPEGLFRELDSLGITVQSEIDPEIKVGLTGGVAAVAETGSVVLTGGPGKPLLASLLPEIHIAIIRSGQFVHTLQEALQLEALQKANASVLVSGPSRTGDIELTLTVGVHGPKRVVVFYLP